LIKEAMMPITKRAFLIILASVLAVAGLVPVAEADSPRTPVPVYAPNGQAADPGIATDGEDFYTFITGGLAGVLKAPEVQGDWTAQGNALSRWPAWASGAGAVWAPDATRTEQGWVLYYALIAKGFGGQRCIGTAVADHPAGPYQPSDTPLICPILGGEDPVAGRPVPGSGVIDPSPFVDTDGTRYLAYKTQRSPGTIRLVKMAADGLHTAGEPSRELVRQHDSIENPVLVKRGDQYVLFASANWYDQCRYTTVWRRSTDIWSFADKPEHVLLDQANTGLCGPGGADVVSTEGDDTRPNRMILHGWVCSPTNTPCAGGDGPVTDPNKRRVLYVAVLTWGADGATPSVPAFLR
jgi:beta-xylosidase